MPAEDATPQRDAPVDAAGLKESYPDYEGQIEHVARRSAAAAATVPAGDVLPADLADALDVAPYTHQAAALDALADGEDVCVATSTSSGKTLVYALQVARNYLRDGDTRALFVYPTKALGRDQERQLNDLYDDLGLDLTVAVYDGDTPSDRRPRIRERANVVVSNFAGVNAYLGYHAKWADFMADCDLLAVDEAHAYTGVHGMHVAWTIRRLRRVLSHYGSDPQVVCTSATIGNPAEHCEALTGTRVTVVDDDGSPRGARDVVLWDPPVDEDALPADATGDGERSAGGDGNADFATYRRARRSAGQEMASILAHLGLAGVQTLAFTRSRQGAEVGAKQARRAADAHPADGRLAVEPYHAGHGKETRRGTEYQLKRGALDGVVSTSALELGIDVGSVDATVLAGYPGTRQSFWQRVGRAGRGRSDALSVLVARDDAIDRYLLDDPDYLLDDAVEDAVVDLDNDAVYARHLLCAADELPLTADDARWFGGADRLERGVDMWRRAGKLVGDLNRGVLSDAGPRPQADVSMYNTSAVRFDVRRRDGEIDVEPIDRERAYRDFHEGALLLHDGVEYEVVAFEEDAHAPHVVLESVSTNEYTETLSEKSVSGLAVRGSTDLGDGYVLKWGEADVDVHYSHYQRREVQTGDLVHPPRPTGLDPITLHTQVMWIEFPQRVLGETLDAVLGDGDRARRENGGPSRGEADRVLGGGLHAAEHGLIKLAPLELRMDSGDMGGLSTIRHAETGVPTVFVHDAVEGGLGFARAMYDHLASLGEATRTRIAACDCAGTGGCPACVMDRQCGNDNRPLHTDAAVFLLDRVLERL